MMNISTLLFLYSGFSQNIYTIWIGLPSTSCQIHQLSAYLISQLGILIRCVGGVQSKSNIQVNNRLNHSPSTTLLQAAGSRPDIRSSLSRYSRGSAGRWSRQVPLVLLMHLNCHIYITFIIVWSVGGSRVVS